MRHNYRIHKNGVLAAAFGLLLAFGLTIRLDASDRDVTEVTTLEKGLWEAWHNHDLDSILHQTASDYVCVTEDKDITLSEIVRDFERFRLVHYSLGTMTVRRLTGDSVVVTYRAEMEVTVEGKNVTRQLAEASVWVRRKGQWHNALLHEVTVSPAGKQP